MKIAACIITIFFAYLTIGVHAQNITLPVKTVETMLCRIWQSDYATLNGTKIDRKQGAESAIIEFKKDKTFAIKSDRTADNAKGTWNYYQKKKLIVLTIGGVKRMHVISLKSNQLIMTIVAADDLPKDVGDVKIVYKLKR